MKMPENIGRFTWFDDRFYAIPGDELRYFPSSTNILGAYPKPFLARWRGDIGNEAADKKMYDAAHKGTRIHHACECLARGGEVQFQPPFQPVPDVPDCEYFLLTEQEEMFQVERFYLMMQELKPIIKPEEIELTVYSERYEYAGTLDFLMKIEEGSYSIAGKTPIKLPSGLYVADIKSGQASEDHFLQIASYMKAVEEGDGPEIAGGLVIYTNADIRTGIEKLKVVYRTREELEKDFIAFLNVYAVWKHANATQKPKIRTIPASLKLK